MQAQQIQDNFIQKKLLYKFDKKIQQLFQSFFVYLQSGQQSNGQHSMIDENQQQKPSTVKLSKQDLLQQISQLQFQNFKYRTALLSAQKDQVSNQQIIKKSDSQIEETQRQVKDLSSKLQLALRARANKTEYNQLATVLRQYQHRGKQTQKLSNLQSEILQLQTRYARDMQTFGRKERCLKVALAALRTVVQMEQQDPENQILKSNLMGQIINQKNINVQEGQQPQGVQRGQILY